MNRAEYLMVMLAEEASELAQRAAKCLRFGVSDVQEPDGKTYASNNDRLVAEYLDVCTVMEELFELGTVAQPSSTAMDEHFARKKERIEKYAALSVELGRLEGQTAECEDPPTCPVCDTAAFTGECDTCGYRR